MLSVNIQTKECELTNKRDIHTIKKKQREVKSFKKCQEARSQLERRDQDTIENKDSLQRSRGEGQGRKLDKAIRDSLVWNPGTQPRQVTF